MEIIEILESKQANILSAVLMAAAVAGDLCGVAWLGSFLWGTVLICWTPIAYGAITGLIKDRRVAFSLPVTLGLVAALVVGEQMAAAEIALIMAVGELLEHSTVHRAKRGLERLLRLSPAQGRRICGDVEEMVPIESVQIGDILRVLPGETIPADGCVASGGGSVDQALLTGESMPVDKAVGDDVFAGTMNLNGSLDIRVSLAPEDSSLQRLIRLVEESGKRQAPIQREADRWAQWLVPCSLLLALAGFITLRLMGNGVDDALLRAVTVLVTFCPCGLVLATPTGIMAAIGQASRHGVIIKSGSALEALSRVDTICFDKTGTLTEGRPKVTHVQAYTSAAESEILRLAAAVESLSDHPLAKAIAEACDSREPVANFRSHNGNGVEGEVDGRRILCRKRAFLEGAGVVFPEESPSGMTSVYVAADEVLIGRIDLQDTLRQGACRMLQELGLGTVLLTGDSTAAAKAVAQPLPLQEIHAALLPEDKAAHIQRLKQQGRIVAMVGDGINDAPALKQADVGISMSRLGTDIATEAADISLMQDDLSRLPYLLCLAKATLRCIRFNIALALGINAVAVVLGLLGLLSPLTGSLAHNLGSFVVILNASFLYNRRFF